MITATQARENFKNPISELFGHIKRVSNDCRTTDYFCHYEKPEVIENMIIVLETQGFTVEFKTDAGAKRLRIRW